MARACNCFARNDCVIKSLVFILLHFTVQQINIDKKPGFRVYSTNASGLIELYRKSEVRLVTRTLPPPSLPRRKVCRMTRKIKDNRLLQSVPLNSTDIRGKPILSYLSDTFPCHRGQSYRLAQPALSCSPNARAHERSERRSKPDAHAPRFAPDATGS